MKNFKFAHIYFKKNAPKVFGFFMLIMLAIVPAVSFAQADDPTQNFKDPTKDTFKLAVCDGPENLNHITSSGKIDLTYFMDKSDPGRFKSEFGHDGAFIPCNFRGLMIQIQHLIDVMMIVGVFAAIGAFSWAGALYISGNPKKIEDAHKIFPKVFFGFIIMLSAWFIVYQILSWLTDNAAFTSLFDKP